MEKEAMPAMTGHTQLTGLLGDPVAHSLSPLMHNLAFRSLGLDYVYLCFRVGEADLETAVRGLAACGVRGFNLTMPDKNRMAELADTLSPAARLIGAVNTVVNENGRLMGHNTDGLGFLRALREAGCPIGGATMTLLGAGGAATAIAVQAALDGAEKIQIFARGTSRFHRRTVQLADRLNAETACEVQLHELSDTAALAASLAESSLLVNGTPVGMAPDAGRSLLADTRLFHEGLFVSDIIYEPRQTRLLQLAAAAGCPTMNGLYMLLYQGAEAFRLWTGRDMPTELVKQTYFRG